MLRLLCGRRRRRRGLWPGPGLREPGFVCRLLLLAVAVSSVSGRNSGQTSLLPELDEIDNLSSVIAKQQENQPAAKSAVSKSQPTSHNASHSTTVKPVTHRPVTPPRQTAKLPKGSGHSKPFITSLTSDSLLIIMMSVSVLLGLVALVLAMFCWIRLQKGSHLSEKTDYPAFQKVESSSSNNNATGDKKLAQSAQMYHYQHQKQQMISMEKHKAEPKVSTSRTSDEENEDGDFTVYECPGLAPTGEMEVKNPLFDDSALQPGTNHK